MILAIHSSIYVVVVDWSRTYSQLSTVYLIKLTKRKTVKQVQDHYFRKAKKEGYPARSVYKLEEAQTRFHFLKRGDKVLDIGAYPGSWSMYASKVVGPQGKVVAVDLQAGKRMQQSGRAAIEFVGGDIHR